MDGRKRSRTGRFHLLVFAPVLGYNITCPQTHSLPPNRSPAFRALSHGRNLQLFKEIMAFRFVRLVIFQTSPLIWFQRVQGIVSTCQIRDAKIGAFGAIEPFICSRHVRFYTMATSQCKALLPTPSPKSFFLVSQISIPRPASHNTKSGLLPTSVAKLH